MKWLKSTFYFLLSFSFFLTSCSEEAAFQEITERISVPVYKSVDEIRATIQIQAPQTIQEGGKIFSNDRLLLINDVRRGIHVFDNTDLNRPIKIGFLPIAGNLDMIVVDDLLYADNYMDLLAFDMADLNNIQFLSRTKDVFPFDDINEEGEYLVYYTIEEVKKLVEPAPNDNTFDSFIPSNNHKVGDRYGNYVSSSTKESVPYSSSFQSRFAFQNGMLYHVDLQRLNIFSIDDIKNIRLEKSQALENQLNHAQHLMTSENLLLVASQNNVLLYQTTNAVHPTFVSFLLHANACTPVFLDKKRAFIGLNENAHCAGWTNRLIELDVSDLNLNQQISTQAFANPKRILKYDHYLFIAKGEEGISILDIEKKQSELEKFSTLKKYPLDAQDIQLLEKENELYLLVLHQDGISQFKVDTTDWSMEKLSYQGL